MYDTRANTLLKTSGGAYVDEETGEIIQPRGRQKPRDMPAGYIDGLFNVTMPKYQSYRRNRSNFTIPKINLPNPATMINIGVLAAICLGGYKLYQHFFAGDIIQNATEKKADQGAAAVAAAVVNQNQADTSQINHTASSLSNIGLVPSALHASLANTFHEYFDTGFPDHSKIVKTILNENVQTFRLVSVAYGYRAIDDYLFWSIIYSLKPKGSVFNLKQTLQMILSDSEISKLHDYISVI